MSTVSRVVLVTAGGSGIGFAIAKYFVQQGDKVHICDVDQLAIDKALTELPTMTATCAELTQIDQVDTVFDDLRTGTSYQIDTEGDVMLARINFDGIGPITSSDTLDFTFTMEVE